MKFEVTKHKNGYLIRAEDEVEGIVCEEQEEDEMSAWATFLRVLTNHYGPSSSRHSKERIYIRVEPGDKWEPSEGEKDEDYYCSTCNSYIKKD